MNRRCGVMTPSVRGMLASTAAGAPLANPSHLAVVQPIPSKAVGAIYVFLLLLPDWRDVQRRGGCRGGGFRCGGWGDRLRRPPPEHHCMLIATRILFSRIRAWSQGGPCARAGRGVVVRRPSRIGQQARTHAARSGRSLAPALAAACWQGFLVRSLSPSCSLSDSSFYHGTMQSFS